MRIIRNIIITCHLIVIVVSTSLEEPPYSKYPFIASIQKSDGAHICSGSLVGFEWVLTSAHCVLAYVKTPESIQVRAGQPNTPEEQMRLAMKIYCHDKFESESMFNDIALILLDQPFRKQKSVNICYVPKYTMHIEIRTHCKSVLVVGMDTETTKEGRIPLITYNQTVLSEEQCAKIRKFQVLKHTFCGYAKNMTACMWDTGGPAICEGLIYGITFYGCPWDQSPSYFTRVDRYLIFIERIMGDKAPYPTAKRSCGEQIAARLFPLAFLPFLVFVRKPDCRIMNC